MVEHAEQEAWLLRGAAQGGGAEAGGGQERFQAFRLGSQNMMY